MSVCITDGDEHAQLALAGVLGVYVELDGEAGRDAAGQPGATGSHFAGIMSGQNPKLEGTEEITDTQRQKAQDPDNDPLHQSFCTAVPLCTCGGRPPLHT